MSMENSDKETPLYKLTSPDLGLFHSYRLNSINLLNREIDHLIILLSCCIDKSFLLSIIATEYNFIGYGIASAQEIKQENLGLLSVIGPE